MPIKNISYLRNLYNKVSSNNYKINLSDQDYNDVNRILDNDNSENFFFAYDNKSIFQILTIFFSNNQIILEKDETITIEIFKNGNISVSCLNRPGKSKEIKNLLLSSEELINILININEDSLDNKDIIFKYIYRK